MPFYGHGECYTNIEDFQETSFGSMGNRFNGWLKYALIFLLPLQFCNVLHCNALYWAASNRTALHWSALLKTALNYTVLYISALYWYAHHCTELNNSVLLVCLPSNAYFWLYFFLLPHIFTKLATLRLKLPFYSHSKCYTNIQHLQDTSLCNLKEFTYMETKICNDTSATRTKLTCAEPYCISLQRAALYSTAA